jgi:formate--tetrahydrofolate ligase
MDNLKRHVENVQTHFGLSCVVAINRFTTDTAEEFRVVESMLEEYNVPVLAATHWASGGEGAEALARVVVSLAERPRRPCSFLYDDALSLWDKLTAVATKIYRASSVTGSEAVLAQVAAYQAAGYGHYPVCVAKTQYSFSSDPTVRGAPTGHTLNVREVRLAAGAEFVVFICGDLMTMPGLPREPAAHRIDVDAQGRIVGLS